MSVFVVLQWLNTRATASSDATHGHFAAGYLILELLISVGGDLQPLTSMNYNTAAVFTSYPSAYNLKCPREVIDCLVRNNGSVLKVIRTPFYQKNRRVDIVVSRQIGGSNIDMDVRMMKEVIGKFLYFSRPRSAPHENLSIWSNLLHNFLI